jgi:selenide,water dikinase
MQTFLSQLDERLEKLNAVADAEPLRVAIVGGGAGGVEIALCLPARLKQKLGSRAWQISLIESNQQILNGTGRLTQRVATRELTRRGIPILPGKRVSQVAEHVISFDDGTTLPADLVLWITDAEPPPLLGKLGLPTDERGFLITRPTLQTLADDRIFAVGDSGSIQKHPAPKAGVYAVRQGKILWGNLHRSVFARPLIRYQPQRGFLSLLAIGDGRAILSYRGLALAGRWCWRLKDSIDRSFVEQFRM